MLARMQLGLSASRRLSRLPSVSRATFLPSVSSPRTTIMCSLTLVSSFPTSFPIKPFAHNPQSLASDLVPRRSLPVAVGRRAMLTSFQSCLFPCNWNCFISRPQSTKRRASDPLGPFQGKCGEPSVTSAVAATECIIEEPSEEFIVINFYKLTEIVNPLLCVEEHLSFVQDRCLDIKGRILINGQGINAQFSGPRSDAFTYADWVRSHPNFYDVALQVSPSPRGHAFPRLKLRYKPSLVQVQGGTQSLPLTDPGKRAVPLSPAEWRQFLRRRTESTGDRQKQAEMGSEPVLCEVEEVGSGREGEGHSPKEGRARPVLLLDVRNGYEWDVGHFDGALRPPVDSFRTTEFGLKGQGESTGEREGEVQELREMSLEDPSGDAAEIESPLSPKGSPRAIAPPGWGPRGSGAAGEGGDPLAGVDKENTDILMYCTGGIRCDVFSTLLREKGFTNLYALEGGVARYLKEEGSDFWNGHLFVFDSRLAVHPKDYSQHSENIFPMDGSSKGQAQAASEDSLVRCSVCAGELELVRHRNCANADCNALILMCQECAQSLQGACSAECSMSPRLRPYLETPEPYKRSHHYLQAPPKQRLPGAVSRRAQKRRARRFARLQLENAKEESNSSP